ncbi:cold shock and DUF1294 domain-containing protein [Tautonia rosea]|uniref:cold shock and DUF1294 domain-containing protein n=1 Tax=Tautonia rosea TaxID=2728037 RepID=UPI001472E5A0|nr:cold shock and DUF1294 domain-containing protein [Tautonia rosea]
MSQEAQGVVVSFDDDRGFGFIRTSALKEDVFVHVSAIEGGGLLRPGQRVRFSVEPGDRGPRAVRVIPGSVGLTPARTAAVGLLGFLVVATIGLVMIGLPWQVAWLILVNAATLAVWTWDKHRAVRDGRRVPEAVLLGLAAIGGSVGAWIGIGGLGHKRRKSRFVLAMGVITGLQGIGILLWLLGVFQGSS